MSIESPLYNKKKEKESLIVPEGYDFKVRMTMQIIPPLLGSMTPEKINVLNEDILDGLKKGGAQDERKKELVDIYTKDALEKFNVKDIWPLYEEMVELSNKDNSGGVNFRPKRLNTFTEDYCDLVAKQSDVQTRKSVEEISAFNALRGRGHQSVQNQVAFFLRDLELLGKNHEDFASRAKALKTGLHQLGMSEKIKTSSDILDIIGIDESEAPLRRLRGAQTPEEKKEVLETNLNGPHEDTFADREKKVAERKILLAKDGISENDIASFHDAVHNFALAYGYRREMDGMKERDADREKKMIEKIEERRRKKLVERMMGKEKIA